MSSTHSTSSHRQRHRGRRFAALVAGVCAAVVLTACGDVDGPVAFDPDRAYSGGDTTVFDQSRNAFALTARNLLDERRDLFFVGNSVFNRNWVRAPASTTGVDGLGPTFNANSCSACHFKDGRGAPPLQEGQAFLGLLLRLSVPGEDEHGGPLGEPNYGGQFNHRAILDVPSEGNAAVSYEEIDGQYDDGAPFVLHHPTYTFSDLGYGPMADDVMVSPRVAPVVAGLGLIEALTEKSILAHADEDDDNGDGISGRPNYVWDSKNQRTALGRFGWKANQANLEDQNSGAFLGDIGITSPLFPDENCPSVQTACAAAKNGGEPEVDQDKINDVTYYTHLLAVPARRDIDDPQVKQGETLFREIGCADCHVTKFKTGVLADFPEVSNQTIRPYSDFLLHDMGDELSDRRPDYLATGNEWRTPPLWGIGLVEITNGHTRFLHDGRAFNLEEAVLWHGGEAQDSRDNFVSLRAKERGALLRFLGSL